MKNEIKTKALESSMTNMKDLKTRINKVISNPKQVYELEVKL